MKAQPPPPAIEAKIRETLRYDPETGLLYRRAHTITKRIRRYLKKQKRLVDYEFPKEVPEKEIGAEHSLGYRKVAIQVDGVIFNTLVHRIAWYLSHGEWADELDHINGDKDDNRLCNLRTCTHSENAMNKPKNSGRSQYKGVCYQAKSWHAEGKPWVAKISHQGKRLYLGCFATEAEAARAYNAKALELFGEFAQLNEL